MNGVKGLILKEFYLRRKTMLSGLMVFILLFILAVSFCLSFDYGNLKNSADLTPDSAVILAYAVAGVGIVLFSQNSEVIAKDVKCRWNIFEYTLPLSAQKLAAVRMGLILCANLLGLVIAALLSWVIFTLAHQKFSLVTFKNISVIALFVFMLVVLVNFMNLKYRNPQTAVSRLMAWLLSVCSFAAIFIYMKFSEIQGQISDFPEEELKKILAETYLTPVFLLRDKLFPYFILIYALITAAGYFLFLGQVRRREKEWQA